MIRVWADGKRAGVLDRLGPKGSTFAYDPIAKSDSAASILMPVRIQSYDSKHSLLPIFEMNLPEGALRERLTRRFAKATGKFDDIDLLGIVGRSQIGRLRYSGLDEDLSESLPLQSIAEILRARRDGGLFDYLLDQFAEHSGLSGVQPKVMIRAADSKLSDPNVRKSPTIQAATHIVKFWDEQDFPELAANEFFCLSVAKTLGMTVPNFELSDDGGALVVQRFDLADDRYLGFEDFCALNALGSNNKYEGGYESRLFRRMRDFAAPAESQKTLEDLFKLFVLNCAIRNGDAHLKNFGITYDDVNGPIQMAPIYDLVTTTAYMPNDTMALTLDGSTKWPDRKRLVRLAQIRSDLSQKKVDEIFEATADAMSSVGPKVREYFLHKENDVGTRMLDAWETGIKESLELTKGLVAPQPFNTKQKPPVAKSDGILLEQLRQNGGSLSGTLKSISTSIGVPESTLSTSLKRLTEKGFIARSKRRIILVSKEV